MHTFTPEFIKKQKEWLEARRKSKRAILARGGQRAAMHSESDITRIDFALKRIEQGQYGLCTNCGSPIELQRLVKFQPETPFCFSCQPQSKKR